MLTKSSKSLTILAVGLGMGLTIGSSLPAIAYVPENAPTPSSEQASFNTQGTLVAQRLSFSNQRIRPSRNRIGGIARGECGTTDSSIKPIALLPPSSSEIAARNQLEVEATISEHPTFFVYLPATEAEQVEFLLTTEDPGQIIYETTFDIPDTPGIVGVKLPIDVPALEVSHFYNWSLTMLCDPVDRSSNPSVEGWVERIEPNSFLAMRLQGAHVRDLPAIYSAAGIWQDTLASLAELRYENPNDPELQADWVSLLNSVDLENIADVPLLTIENESATDHLNDYDCPIPERSQN